MLEGSGMEGFLVGGASLKAREFAAIAGLLP
jgi:triosephosphate isomerase